MSRQSKVSLLKEEVALLEKQLEYKEGLPHLYGYKWYPWAREFFESTNKEVLCCAANQISKSSTQIRTCIDWATDKSKWAKLWRMQPNQFWYLYPNKDTATTEFETKWKLFLPRGKFKDDPVYGWKAEYDRKQIKSLHFNSGITVYFKTYAQDVQDLQAGTCFAIFCDEELPTQILPELQFRMAATDGYFRMVFTATLGQEHWRMAMEEPEHQDSPHPDALKLQVSMYDCLYYEDGSPSHWTPERIEDIKRKCGTQSEILRRVYGRFVVSAGLKYAAFDRERNRSDNHPLPRDWLIYSAVDIGSGGESSHPAAIVFVAVNPLFTKARVFKAWRGDGISTASTDILLKYLEMKGNLKPVAQYYDYQSREFSLVTTRLGEPFLPAEKAHEVGESTLNSLFKNNMLSVQRGDPELEKLCNELSSLMHSTPKQRARDDLVDALRYAVVKIPWDWTSIEGAPGEPIKKEHVPTIDEQRRAGFMDGDDKELLANLEDELEAWNELYDV